MNAILIITRGHPTQARRNLHSFLKEKQLLPTGAKLLDEIALLPPLVRTMLHSIKESGGSWMAWRHKNALWFYACWITALEHGRSRRVVLRIRRYRASGRLRESSEWIRKPGGSWSRLDVH